MTGTDQEALPTGPVGRFAPSPSGPLHLGSLFAAVLSWLDARAADGRWLLRIEDIDPPREIPGSIDAILRALDRHGLHWDGEVLYQSSREDAYLAALETLADQGRLFRCNCTRRQLRAAGGVYPGTCRHHPPATGPDDPPSALRVRVDPGLIEFTDRLQGRYRQDLATEVGDFVVRRKDGLWAYQLVVVVDDAFQGITDVVRGIALIDSTPRQIFLQRCLGLPGVRYLHFPVLRGGDDAKLSKQTGAPGIDPQAAPANLARVLGWLGLPADPRAPVEEQLAVALAAWDPRRLPRDDIRVGEDRAGAD
jgi:glutamyl-Q tRNA(Asp) synthetase